QSGPFQWDTFEIPKNNPWQSRMRCTGLDFTPDGKAAIISCWDGDVWRVNGINDNQATTVRWQRIASGLFQPLGIKLIGKDIHVSCRDQIVKLVDLNGDGETDFYQNFNSDHQVTEHFHEFAMGLQSDEQGNLYYAKSGRHARTALVPHHGTLIKVSADGKKSEILGKGFRAANGICRNPDGTFFVTDQEGYWNPMNRVNHVIPGDRFYGNMWGYGAPKDSSDSLMEQPLCWVDKKFDRSPAELLWIDSKKWGPLKGQLMHVSYGHGRMQIVPYETIKGQMQGGMVQLPIPDLPTGTMRGRFHPGDQQLYICGMSAWGTSRRQEPGGFYRIRATGEPFYLPIGLNAHSGGVNITFSDPLDPKSINELAKQFQVRTWALKRTERYGSKHYDERSHAITDATLSKDGTILKLKIDDMQPVWQMSIKYQLKSKTGKSVEGEIQNTIHHLAKNRHP
ncbi:MAG: heme-binding protein, partial [Verrucomicrobiae bacterium]|nr:heme-binding protein [Verrucomicrobiae bacterium]NNJ87454.1 heme-binding protein [Akkermansiaceae bacterium]